MHIRQTLPRIPLRPKSPVESGKASPNASVEKPVPNWPADRNYKIHYPENYDPANPTPVMVVVHGYTHDAGVMENMTSPDGNPSNPDSLNSLADREGFVVVYPNGTPLGRFRKGRGWNGGGGANGYAPVSSPAVENNYNDIGFLNDVLDEVEKEVNVDKSRVFGAGISNGGAMAYRMAAEMSDRFAAIAVVAAGDQYAYANNTTEPERDMPLMVMHGEKDPVWPYEGGSIAFGKMCTVPGSVEKWAGWNQAELKSTELLPDVDPNDGTRVEKKVYQGATPSSDVEFYTVKGGGHAWPGGHQFSPEFQIGKVTRDINANEIMWDFFEAHPKQ